MVLFPHIGGFLYLQGGAECLKYAHKQGLLSQVKGYQAAEP